MNFSDDSQAGAAGSAPDVSRAAEGGSSLGETTLVELERRVRSLSTALQIVLAVCIVVIGIVNVMLFQQIRSIRRAGLAMQETARAMRAGVNEYSTNTAPLLKRFYGDLKAFSAQNGEYAAIFSHYPSISDGGDIHATNLPAAPRSNPPAAAPARR